MKGLMYKDIIVNKMSVISIGIIVIYVALSFVLSSIELEGNDNIASIIFNVIAGVFSLVYVLASSPVESCTEDNKTKWNNYAMAFPGGIKRIILEKYMLGLIGNAISITLSLIMIFVCSLIYNIDSMTTKIFVMWLMLWVGIMLTIQAFFMPVFIRGKVGIAQGIAAFCLISVIIGGYTYLALGDISFLTEGDSISRVVRFLTANERNMWLVLSIFVGIGAILEFISYHICVLLYKKD